MRKSKDKLVVMVIYWQNHLVRPVPKKWIQVHLPLTAVLVSWLWQKHAAIDPARSCCPITSCAAQLIHLIAVPLLFFLPLPLYAQLTLSGSQLPPPLNFWFQNWSRWTKHCREAHQATCDASNCVKGQALARKRKRGGVRGREVELVRAEWDCTVPIQCLHTKDHWV